MPSATLVGGQAPQQIAGNNTDPVVIRNLSATANVYLGFATSLSPASAEMVMLPGELYRSPGGAPVYVVTDAGATASILYNTSGTGVDLSGPTSVITTNGQKTLYGPVGQVATAGAGGQTALIPFAKPVDVSSYSFLYCNALDDANPAYTETGFYRINIAWLDINGAFLAVDSFECMRFGAAYAGFRVKGVSCFITVTGDNNTPVTEPFKYEFVLTTSTPAEYFTANPFWKNTQLKKYNIPSMPINSEYEGGGANAPKTLQLRASIPAGGGAYYLFDSWKGRMQGTIYASGGEIRVKGTAFGRNIADANLNSVVPVPPVNTEVGYTALLGAQTYELHFNNNTGAGQLYAFSATFGD